MRYKRLIKLIYFILTGVTFTLNVFAEPQLDGRFFGGGDNSEYILLSENSGNGEIYYYQTDIDLYLAVVVSTDINDNVFGRDNFWEYLFYYGALGWVYHTAADLINANYLEMKIVCDNGTFNWKQDLLSDSDGDYDPNESDWTSLVYEGNVPAGTSVFSSSAYNFNLDTYDITLGGLRTSINDYRAPAELFSAPGYPSYDTSTNWEWPIVYEMKIPLSSLGSGSVSVEALTVNNIPAKNDVINFSLDNSSSYDYGDAPDSYKTLSSNQGAFHMANSGGIYLGSAVDSEFEANSSTSCLGDDDDGIIFLNSWSKGGTANMEIIAHGSGMLSAWADFNGDGDWDDVEEQIFIDRPLNDGVNNLQVSIPGDALTGEVVTRFRFSNETGLLSYGAAFDGEVEDYSIEVFESLVSLGDKVWHDIVPNFIQDDFEPGIEGVTVNLYDETNQIIQTTTTDDQGKYLFSDLIPDTYYLGFEIETEWNFVIPDMGNDNLDSDVIPSTMQTIPYTLEAGDENLSVDCGVYSSDPLPVELNIFNVTFVNYKAKLQWVTQSESSNAFWNVYRSTSANIGQAVQINYSNILGAGNSSEPTDYSYYDDTVSEFVEQNNLQNPTIWYWLESVSYDGESHLHGPVSIMIPISGGNVTPPELYSKYGISSNYPNPFNPFTIISFQLKMSSKASLEIYNVKGEKISTLFKDRAIEADRVLREKWEGKDISGHLVSSGIYFAVLKTSAGCYAKKMILQK